MIKFETINGTLCRMVEPTPLTPEANFPCVVRLIQDDSPMGRNNDFYAISHLLAHIEIINGLDAIHFVRWQGSKTHYSRFEIIGYPVVDGSHWWALYQMMKGKKVSYKSAIGNVYWALNQDGNVQHYDMDDLAYIGTIRSKLEFAENYAVKTGWQLYEPKPETAKEPEIVAHKQHANCLVCGKEIEGLLDGHATVSIKRYSISSLYESTYSHYCGKCFLELGFDATERELRNRQQPIAETEPEQPKYKVGDWAEYRLDGDTYYGKICNIHGYVYYLSVTTEEIPKDQARAIMLESIIRKLNPSEVVLNFGNGIKGRVCMPYPERGLSVLDDNNDWIAQIDPDALDAPMRKLVKALLKAQGGAE